jgi:LysR family glycine cleavage system transcriptional activator
MARFSRAAALRLRVSEGAPCTDFAVNDADLVVQWADAPVPGCVVEPLMRSGRFPVVAPALRASARIERPEDLLGVTLMHDETMDQWAEWFRAAGLAPPELPRGPRFPNCELSTTAAEQGQGVSLAYEHMVRDTLASGRLERLFDTVIMPFTIYAVVYPERRRRDPLVRAFRAFLFAEMAGQARPVAWTGAAE